MFDFGLTRNLIRYGYFSPPDYNLKAITAPVFLHYSDNDGLAAVKDVKELAAKLGNLANLTKVPDPMFTHVDFILGSKADTLLYKDVINIIDRY